jgi:hypothetical protein
MVIYPILRVFKNSSSGLVEVCFQKPFETRLNNLSPDRKRSIFDDWDDKIRATGIPSRIQDMFSATGDVLVVNGFTEHKSGRAWSKSFPPKPRRDIYASRSKQAAAPTADVVKEAVKEVSAAYELKFQWEFRSEIDLYTGYLKDNPVVVLWVQPGTEMMAFRFTGGSPEEWDADVTDCLIALGFRFYEKNQYAYRGKTPVKAAYHKELHVNAPNLKGILREVSKDHGLDLKWVYETGAYNAGYIDDICVAQFLVIHEEDHFKLTFNFRFPFGINAEIDAWAEDVTDRLLAAGFRDYTGMYLDADRPGFVIYTPDSSPRPES